MVVVSEVSLDDWQTLRDVRLAALRDAPTAFASSYAREAAFTREQWHGRFSARSVTFFARLPGIAEPVGMAGLYVLDGIADLVSMWVRPAARGHQVGEALVTAAADRARADGHDALYLWVTESNKPARGLYLRCGFALTGERQPLPSDPALSEVRMRRPLLRREPVGAAEQKRRVADRVQSQRRHQQGGRAPGRGRRAAGSRSESSSGSPARARGSGLSPPPGAAARRSGARAARAGVVAYEHELHRALQAERLHPARDGDGLADVAGQVCY